MGCSIFQRRILKIATWPWAICQASRGPVLCSDFGQFPPSQPDTRSNTIDSRRSTVMIHANNGNKKNIGEIWRGPPVATCCFYRLLATCCNIVCSIHFLLGLCSRSIIFYPFSGASTDQRLRQRSQWWPLGISAVCLRSSKEVRHGRSRCSGWSWQSSKDCGHG